jgi:hypothetical protein
MRSTRSRLGTVALALTAITAIAAACNTPAAGSSPAASTAPVARSSLTATSVPEATATSPDPSGLETSSPGGPSSTPGDIDPCSLLTQAEASTLMGKALGAGVSTVAEPERVCTFKTGLTEVKLFLAPPAPSAATAQAYWDEARAEVPAGLPVTDLNLFDRSAFGAGSAGGLSLSALFVIDGQYFFDLYCGLPGCSQDASVTAADLIAGRLP